MADALSNIITNPTSTFHGSFNATARIIKVDNGNLVDTYTVKITCTDLMGATSGTRNPRLKVNIPAKLLFPTTIMAPMDI
jgi:hypothetical protein